MPVTLLPASAAAGSARAPPTIVLGKKAEAWLTQALKRVNRIKRPLNNVGQHHRCLTETLSSPTAIWTLCSLLLPKHPESELCRDENPLVEALANYQWIHVEAYVVHLDMVSQNEVSFKLTSDTIESLIDYHKDIFSVDESAAHHNWNEKEVQLKKLQENFVTAINKFVFRTGATALEGLEDDGSGELMVPAADEVKTKILGMFLPLMPPPPPAPQVVRPAPILPSNHGPEAAWWPSAIASQHQHQHQQQHQYQQQQQQHQQHQQVQSQETWNTVSSSPTLSTPTHSYAPQWPTATSQSMSEPHAVSPSLTPEYSPPYSPEEAFTPTHDWTSQPEYFETPATCAPYSLPMQFPSMIAGGCGTSAGLDGANVLGFSGMGMEMGLGMGLGMNENFGYSEMLPPSMAYATSL